MGEPSDDVDMMEFLIRTRSGHDWPAVRRDRLVEVLTPANWRGQAEIAFSAEDTGWLVLINGPMEPEAAQRLKPAAY